MTQGSVGLSGELSKTFCSHFLFRSVADHRLAGMKKMLRKILIRGD